MSIALTSFRMDHDVDRLPELFAEMQKFVTDAATSVKDVDAYDFRKQQTAFCIVTLFTLGILLLIHTVFRSVIGEPSLMIVAVLGISFVLRLAELVWIQSRQHFGKRAARADGIASIVSLLLLAVVLVWLANTDHSPYQVLLALPILQAACLFDLFTTAITILVADGTIFLWLYHYLIFNPESSGSDYLEGGMLSTVLALTGALSWSLMRMLRNHESALSSALADLRATKLQLANEEKLAAIGRLASGIAHEIRNPLAMIMSSLATAIEPTTTPEDRDEMFAIAQRQTSRLEALTSDFLKYARPADPRRAPVPVCELLSTVETLTRMRANGKPIRIDCCCPDGLIGFFDTSQIEAALLNLTLNALEAVSESGVISLRASLEKPWLRIEVENTGNPIPDTALEGIFEPFFTTKRHGTGLGLAMAKAAAHAHGGDLWVSHNRKGRVTFVFTIANGAK